MTALREERADLERYRDGPGKISRSQSSGGRSKRRCRG
jgi:hypothetical protein